MFRHPAWAVGSYSSDPPAAGTLGTKSTGGFYQADKSPCSFATCTVLVDALDFTQAEHDLIPLAHPSARNGNGAIFLPIMTTPV